ncbi:MAG: protease SohB [Buchnera aphidicola (Melaphis rhois)]
MSSISDYILFLLKIFTLLFLVAFAIFIVLNIKQKKKKQKKKLDIISLNDHYISMKHQIIMSSLSKYEQKMWYKRNEKIKKDKLKQDIKLIKKNSNYILNNKKPILYVIDFKGDINATAVASLREEISAILLVYRKNDEVLLRLESGGGTIHGYGLASAQLQRLRKKNIYLTVSVDKIAASGGYMMACIANHIIGAPFSIIGSIGVIAQIPNFYKLLKKNNIDMELHTAGQYKRTLTMFGKNTSESREKFCSELRVTHSLFKKFVCSMRSSINIDEVSNGEYWFGSIALEKGLIDSLNTSDDFILSKIRDFSVLKISYINQKKFLDSFMFKLKHNIKNRVFNILNV